MNTEINPEIVYAIEKYKILLAKLVEMQKVRNTDWNQYLALQTRENELQEQIKLFKPQNDRQRELEQGLLKEWRETSAKVEDAEKKTRSYQEGLEPVRNEVSASRQEIFELFDRYHLNGEIPQVRPPSSSSF